MASNSDGGGGSVSVRYNMKLTYAQVVVSFVTAIALLILALLLVVLRTTWRHRMLIRIRREIRFDGAYLLGKQEGNPSRRIVKAGLMEHRYRITSPPQFDRVMPAVVANARDTRHDCLEMLERIRGLLEQSHGKAARLMSMRCCLGCIRGVLPLEQCERFLHVYEYVVFGVHRVNGCERYVSSDDIKFIHAFFYNTVIKELQ